MQWTRESKSQHENGRRNFSYLAKSLLWDRRVIFSLEALGGTEKLYPIREHSVLFPALGNHGLWH